MSKTSRRILFWCFCAIFATAAPLILLDTAGYRFDTASLRIRKTGLLVVTTNDRSVTTFLNGTATAGAFRDNRLWFEHILPGIVRVRVEKRGYLPWEKQYRVDEGLTTFTSTVLLLPNHTAVKIARGSFSFAPSATFGAMPVFIRTERKAARTFWTLEGDALQPTSDTVATAIPPNRTRVITESTQLVLSTGVDGVEVEERDIHPSTVPPGRPRSVTVAKLPKGAWEFLLSPERFPTVIDADKHLIAVIDRSQSRQLVRGPTLDAQWGTDAVLAVLENRQLTVWDANRKTTQTTALGWNALFVAVPQALPVVFIADRTRLTALERATADPFQQTLFALDEIRAVRVTPDGKRLVVLGSDHDGPGVFLYDFAVAP